MRYAKYSFPKTPKSILAASKSVATLIWQYLTNYSLVNKVMDDKFDMLSSIQKAKANNLAVKTEAIIIKLNAQVDNEIIIGNIKSSTSEEMPSHLIDLNRLYSEEKVYSIVKTKFPELLKLYQQITLLK